MNDFEHSNYDHSDLYGDFRVMASFKDSEDMIQEDLIGDVMLRKDLAHGDMPFELEINGVTYKRED